MTASLVRYVNKNPWGKPGYTKRDLKNVFPRPIGEEFDAFIKAIDENKSYGSEMSFTTELRKKRIQKGLREKFGETAISYIIGGDTVIIGGDNPSFNEPLEFFCYEICIAHSVEDIESLRAEVRNIVAEVIYACDDDEIEEDTSKNELNTYGKTRSLRMELEGSDWQNLTGVWHNAEFFGYNAEDPEWVKKLNSLKGLGRAKAQLIETIDVIRGRRLRGVNGNNEIKNVFTFEGNPGCGKTKFAKIFADCLKEAGIITAKEPFHDESVSNNIGQFIGETEAKIDEIFKNDAGSVIFFDEAYSIGEVSKFGKNAINAIVKRISDMEEHTVLIMAGYPDEMTEFLKKNPGLESRVTKRIMFDDYSLEELLDILESQLEDTGIHYNDKDSAEIRDTFRGLLRAVSYNNDENCGRSIGNARAVINLIREIEVCQSRDLKEKAKGENEGDPRELTLEVAKKVAEEVEDLAWRTGSALGSKKPPYFTSPAELAEYTFDKIIGCGEAKKMLLDQAERMKKAGSNDSNKKDGVSSKGGILLSGYPGCGKTKLSKAFANEISKGGSKVAFVSPDISTLLTDSDTMRKLFRELRSFDRCVLFLDEVDAVGIERTALAANSPQYNALMTLLTELDGLHDTDLFVLSATNHPEVLDRAIARRLGTEIRIELPNEDERVELLKLFLDDKGGNMTDEQLHKLSHQLDGYSGAKIETIVKTALKKAGDAPLNEGTLDEAIKDEQLGHKSNTVISTEERERIAIHEMGHAVAQLLNDPDNKDVAIYMEQRTDGSLGYTDVGGINSIMPTRSQLMNNIKVLLAGKAAEEIFYGVSGTSAGCSNDLAQASQKAVRMVGEFGMGEVLLIRDRNDPDVIKEANNLLKSCYSDVREFLQQRKDIIEKGKEFLEFNDVMSNRKLRELCGMN